MAGEKKAAPGTPLPAPLRPHDLLPPERAAALAALVGAINAGLREHARGSPANAGPYRHDVAEAMRGGLGRHDLMMAVAALYPGWGVAWGIQDKEVLVFRVPEKR